MPYIYNRGMVRSRLVAVVLVVILLGALTGAQQTPTRLLRYPAISQDLIAFVYAGDIWLVPRAGGTATRLSSPLGEEAFPRFSPDGTRLAYSAEYDGNTDVYVVPANGGEPRRLTWHPGADVVQGWTPDGDRVVFTSGRATEAPNAAPRFWTVSSQGGVEEPMALPRAYQGKISPDGKFVAVVLGNGTTKPVNSPLYNTGGLLQVWARNGTQLTKASEIAIGRWCEGVAWSRNSRTLLVQCTADQEISVIRFTGLTGRSLQKTSSIKTKGGPAAIRTAEP